MNLFDLTQQYLIHCKTRTTLSATTIDTYGANLRAVSRWLAVRVGHDPALPDYTPENLRAYLAYCKEKPSKDHTGLAGSTIGAHLCACRAFSRWLIAEGLLLSCPAAGLKSPPKGEASRPRPSDEEMKALLEGCARLYPLRRRLLAAAMISVLCYAGLRRSELLALQVGDIHVGPKPDDNFITVRHGKGDKKRNVYLFLKTAQALRAWMEYRKALRPRPAGAFLWVLDRSRPVGVDTLFDLIRAACQAAGLEFTPSFNPHAQRRGYATYLYRRNVGLKDIQAQLGHSNLAVTDIYIGDDEAKRAAAIQDAGIE